MSKKDKQFELVGKEDFISYLCLLIDFVYKNLKRYNKYFKEYEKTCFEIYQVYDPEAKKISKDLILTMLKDPRYLSFRNTIDLSFDGFSEIQDKARGVSIRLLNSIGDRTKEAMSYNKFRSEVKSRKRILSEENKEDFLVLDDLSQEQNEILNDFYKARNFEAHLPDLKFISQQKYRKKQKIESGLPMHIVPKEIVFINRYEYIELEWLWMGYIDHTDFKESVEKIFQQIKRDYSKLVGKSMSISLIDNKYLPADYIEISNEAINKHVGK